MNLFEAGALFGLPSDIFTAIIESLEDEKAPRSTVAEDFLEYLAFAAHRISPTLIRASV